MQTEERHTCPSCGGAGGGPFGRAGSAWDDENYVCPRCEGMGIVFAVKDDLPASRPGVAKAAPPAVPETKRAQGKR
jgi:ribosomal protein S27AE